MIKRNLVLGMALLLSACGFQLRGTGENKLAIKELDVSARDAYGETVKMLKRQLTGSGVNVHEGAAYKLVLTKQDENQDTASYSGTARSAEYRLSEKLTYEIRSGDMLLLTDSTEVQRVYQHDGNNLIASDQEAGQLRSEMNRDLVQQLMLRLQTITPDRLDQLQQAAETKARAEAAAEAAAQKAMDATPQQSPLQIPTK